MFIFQNTSYFEQILKYMILKTNKKKRNEAQTFKNILLKINIFLTLISLFHFYITVPYFLELHIYQQYQNFPQAKDSQILHDYFLSNRLTYYF